MTDFIVEFYVYISYFVVLLCNMPQSQRQKSASRKKKKTTISDFNLNCFFLLSLLFLMYVPVHVLPLPVYPGSQVQRYEPIVLVHCALT